MALSPEFKYITDLMPRYDGNPKILNYYIREVDNLLSLVEATPPASLAVVCLIKSRLSGAAIDAIAYEENVTSWNDIKRALIRRLGEPRNEIQVMQELTRTRRSKGEDAESFGRKLREMLDTLYSVGQHADKTYYEKMVIEQYINNLDFHVSMGVRISNPSTLELAIVAARQEEARLAYKSYSGFQGPSVPHNKAKVDNPKPNNPYRPMANNNFQPMFNPNNYVPQQNNWTPEQRQQLVNTLPWRNRQPSGNFRNNPGFTWNQPHPQGQPNIPRQQVNPPQKVSDVTMRSTKKPEPPQFAFEELFYTPNEHEQTYTYNNQGEASNAEYEYSQYDGEQQGNPQDFPSDQESSDQS